MLPGSPPPSLPPSPLASLSDVQPSLRQKGGIPSRLQRAAHLHDVDGHGLRLHPFHHVHQPVHDFRTDEAGWGEAFLLREQLDPCAESQARPGLRTAGVFSPPNLWPSPPPTPQGCCASRSHQERNGWTPLATPSSRKGLPGG